MMATQVQPPLPGGALVRMPSTSSLASNGSSERRKFSRMPPTPPPAYPVPPIPRRSDARPSSSRSATHTGGLTINTLRPDQRERITALPQLPPPRSRMRRSPPQPSLPTLEQSPAVEHSPEDFPIPPSFNVQQQSLIPQYANIPQPQPGPPQYTFTVPPRYSSISPPQKHSLPVSQEPIALLQTRSEEHLTQFPQLASSPPALQHAAPHFSSPNRGSPKPASTSSRQHKDSLSLAESETNAAHIDPIMWDYITDVVLDPAQHKLFSLLRKWTVYDVANKNSIFWLQGKSTDVTSILMKRLTRYPYAVPDANKQPRTRISVGLSLRSSGCSRCDITLEFVLSYIISQAIIQLPHLSMLLGSYLSVNWVAHIHEPHLQPKASLADLKAAFEMLVFQQETPILLLLFMDSLDTAKDYKKVYQYFPEVRRRAALPEHFTKMQTRFLFVISSAPKVQWQMIPKPVSNWDWRVINLDALKVDVAASGTTSSRTSVISAERGIAI